MRPLAFRFRPPGTAEPAELRWVLARAFGPLPGPPIELTDSTKAARWAGLLGLGERIASRLSRERLRRDLGETGASKLYVARDALAARTVLLQRLVERVATTALEIGASLVALKGIALIESGFAVCGARPLLDVDLLVEPERASALEAALLDSGFAHSAPAEGHHLPSLAVPGLGEVELHLYIPGLARGTHGRVTARLLSAEGLVRPSTRIRGLALPDPSVLGAHALAHGIDQHGLSAKAYPVTRLIADLIDLAASDDWQPEQAEPWLRSSVSPRELRAIASLCDVLRAGDLGIAGDDARALLHHTLAAVTSASYRRRQRLRSVWRALRRRQWWKFRSELSRRVRPDK